jgi:hypothetical protein
MGTPARKEHSNAEHEEDRTQDPASPHEEHRSEQVGIDDVARQQAGPQVDARSKVVPHHGEPRPPVM